jgi:hypothetical protein
MKSLKYTISLASLFIIFYCSAANKEKQTTIKKNINSEFFIGWATADITPNRPVLLQGQYAARVSERIKDPLMSSALAIESVSGNTSENSILISCDLLYVNDGLRDNVRRLLKEKVPEINSEKIILSATHTHTAPDCSSAPDSKSIYGIEFDVMSPADCQKYVSEVIAKMAEKAWISRKPGGISYGLGFAVVGHNRFWSHFDGTSTRRGNLNSKDFSHIEGFEDHGVNLLYTWDKNKNLTGVLVNIACPSQITGSEYEISADFWTETRSELAKRLGKNVFIMPQLSAAGDHSPHIMVGLKAEERMQKLMFGDSLVGNECMARRKQVAIRIADAVSAVLPYMKKSIDWQPIMFHHTQMVALTRRHVSDSVYRTAIKDSLEYKALFEQQLKIFNENPSLKNKPRWSNDITTIHTLMTRANDVKVRYELERSQPKLPVEIHVLRLGNIVMATNPFELYVDFGTRIKVRSPAVQTFLVQLAGNGTYIPTSRAVVGGAYGTECSSNLVGPEGGQDLVEKTVEMINYIMKEEPIINGLHPKEEKSGY